MTQKKSTKRPNEQLARMKMDSSKVHRYFQLNHSLDGYLEGDSLAPMWLNGKLRWNSALGNFYYRASDGCETMIPNHSFIVEFEKSKWPLIISPAGFEADWFPLSPEDDGYDVLATDNAITRSEEHLLLGKQILERKNQFTRSNDVDDGAYDLPRDESLTPQPSRSEPSESPKKSFASEEKESLARSYAYDETGDSINTRASAGESTLTELQQDLVRLIAQQVFKELSGPPMIRVPESETEEIQRIIKESSLGPMIPYKSYMNTERDASYQNGYDKGFVDGQKQAFQSVREALRTSGLFAAQSSESELERPSGETETAPTEEDLKRLRQHGYEPDSGEDFARAIKQYPTDRSKFKPFV